MKPWMAMPILVALISIGAAWMFRYDVVPLTTADSTAVVVLDRWTHETRACAARQCFVWQH